MAQKITATFTVRDGVNARAVVDTLASNYLPVSVDLPPASVEVEGVTYYARPEGYGRAYSSNRAEVSNLRFVTVETVPDAE